LLFAVFNQISRASTVRQRTDRRSFSVQHRPDKIAESKQLRGNGVSHLPFKLAFLAAVVISLAAWLLLLGSGVWWLILKL
jgi:hypothetical protein